MDEHLQTVSPEKRLANLDSNYNFLEGDELSREDGTASTQEAIDDIDDLLKGINNLSVGKLEVRVRIVKGALGFGFTIADSACGQRVKKILDRQRCKNLLEGDILLEINEINVQHMPHDEVVQVLKNCPYNSEASICVQRGCSNKLVPLKNKPRKLDNRFSNKDIGSAYRSKTPTADIYSTQPREVLPSRPKTPLVDTRTHSKTPVKEMSTSGSDMFKREFGNEYYNTDIHSGLRLSLIDNAEVDIEIDMAENLAQNNGSIDYLMMTDQKYSYPMQASHRYDCMCYDCHSYRSNAIENGSAYEANVRKNVPHEWWPIVQPNPEYIETAVTLNRQELGFGFRIVGGIEDRSQVEVGHIVAGGAADMDGRIRSGDEIVTVDGYSVLKASHRQVVQLINQAGQRGQVHLVLRRRIYATHNGQYVQAATSPNVHDFPMAQGYHMPITPVVHSNNTYDVVVNRNETEGFGFVIISSVNKIGSTIGKSCFFQAV